MNGRLLNYETSKKTSIIEGKRLLNLEMGEEDYLKQFN